MRLPVWFAIGLLLLSAAAAAPAAATGADPQPQQQRPPRSRAEIALSFAPVVKAAAPAVVNVFSVKQPARSRVDPLFSDPFFRFFFEGPMPRRRRPPERSLGSGVIVDPDGLVVTNYHVIDGADEIRVVLTDRREFAATVVGADPRFDLAVLRVDTGGETLPDLPMGNSDELEVGDLVLAIGNPFGIGQTVTTGIVSALARTAPAFGSDVSFIQTDAAINPGNSGGALVTLDGRLVGINTAIVSRSGGSDGIGFAIPVNLVKALIRAVEAGDNGLARPWLGVDGQPVDGDLAAALGLDRPRGVLVNRVYPDGPAARAGIEPGDVILSVDGVDIFEPQQLRFRLAIGRLGDRARLGIWRRRGGGTADLEVPPPRVTALNGRHPLAGATVANMSPGFNEEVGLDMFQRGVVVLAVARGSPASRVGVRPRDVVVAVGDEAIDRVAELAAVLERPRRAWPLVIERGGHRFSVVVRG